MNDAEIFGSPRIVVEARHCFIISKAMSGEPGLPSSNLPFPQSNPHIPKVYRYKGFLDIWLKIASRSSSFTFDHGFFSTKKSSFFFAMLSHLTLAHPSHQLKGSSSS